MSQDWTPETHNAEVPDQVALETNPLIELAFKPDILGKRPAPAEIQLLLAYSRDLLAEAERELQRTIDGPDVMREHIRDFDVHNPDDGNEVAPCK